MSPHSLYKALGNNDIARQTAYQKLFRFEWDSSLVNKIRQATNGGYVFGSEKFQRETALAIGHRTWRGISGRPQKASLKEGQGKFPF